jgi:hypothetical protein
MCTGATGELPAQDTRGAPPDEGPHRYEIPAKGCGSNMRGYQRAVCEEGPDDRRQWAGRAGSKRQT